MLKYEYPKLDQATDGAIKGSKNLSGFSTLGRIMLFIPLLCPAAAHRLCRAGTLGRRFGTARRLYWSRDRSGGAYSNNSGRGFCAALIHIPPHRNFSYGTRAINRRQTTFRTYHLDQYPGRNP